MITIWKTVLRLETQQVIRVPAGAGLLCAREQKGQICVWYKCNDKITVMESRTILIIGTGNEAPVAGRYLGTASLEDGTYMYHVFEM